MSWHTYILKCSDDSYYVGISEKLEARIEAHNKGRGAYYTAKRRPVTLAYHEVFETRSEAMQREKQIKKWTRAKKEDLILGEV